GVGRSPGFARIARLSLAWIPAYAGTTDVRRAGLLRCSGVGRSPGFARIARLSLAWIPAYAGTTDVRRAVSSSLRRRPESRLCARCAYLFGLDPGLRRDDRCSPRCFFAAPA